MLIRRVLSSLHLVDLIAPLQKKFTVHRTLFLHAAWLDQASAHCPIFLTAASRRSLDRVSVPAREPILHRSPFEPSRCRDISYRVLVAVSAGYPLVEGRLLTRYAPFRRSPPESIATPRAAPRLACVKPAASVHPEPGSNSSLYNMSISLS